MPQKKNRRKMGVVGLLLLGALGWDLYRAPERQWSAAVLLVGIETYQRRVSPALSGAGIKCRFRPTCSIYAETVIRQEGVVRGSWRALRRIARCGPWTPEGTLDPP